MLIERVLRRVAAGLPRGVSYRLGGAYASVLREYTFAGAEFASFWKRLRRTERADRERLERLQWRKFKVLLAHAYRNVSFYRRRFAEADVTPDDVVTRADLVRIPPLRREDVRRHPDDLLADGVRVADLFLKRTSGSTGASLHVYHDRACHVSMRAAVARWRTMAGCDPFRSRVVATGVYGPARPSERRRFTRYDPVHHVLYLPSTTLSPEALDEYAVELRTLRPQILQGVASTLYVVACHMKEHGVRGVHPRAVLPSGDLLLPRYREVLESVFGAEVYDTYGMVERTASAAECSEHDGMHLDMDLCLVETVDDLGRPVEEETGHLLGTNLDNFAMPLIRYETGDLGRISRRFCPCGRRSLLLEGLEGRSGDVLRTSDGRMLAAGGVGNLVKHIDTLREFQVVQHAADRIEIATVWDPGSSDVESVRQAFRRALGDAVTISVHVTDAVERTPAGKVRLIVSRVADTDGR